MFNTPGDPRSTTFGFNGGKWRVWIKPPGATMVSIMCMGSGGTGGDGTATYLGDPPSAVATGGTGGASGAVTRLVIPAMFLPDVLYVQVSSGGAPSYVSIYPSTTLQYVVLTSGGAATTSAATAAAASSMVWGNLGVWSSIAGTISATWGAGGLPATAGGTGAGSTTSSELAGTTITAGGLYKGNLKEGYWYKPLQITGGGAGASLVGAVAQTAYRGEMGSGGGGGAAFISSDGTNASTTTGAAGGHGLVVIGAW